MKKLSLFFALFLALSLSAEDKEYFVNLNDFDFRGYGFYANKTTLLGNFGEPANVEIPDPECGPFKSKAGNTFYQYMYNNFNYIGNETKGFQIENIKFDSKGKIELLYKGQKLTGAISIREFENIFNLPKGNPLTNKEDGSIVFYTTAGDEAVTFYFQSNKLLNFEYWNPCE